MEAQDLVEKYLDSTKMMQIATVNNSQPWICTVYFTFDEKFNLYWLSLPTRRHSLEIEKNNIVAIAIPVKFDKQPVVGMQFEGSVEIVNDANVVKNIMETYVKRHDQGHDYYENFVNNKAQHKVYKFTPRKYVLFDEVNFSDNPRQEWSA